MGRGINESVRMSVCYEENGLLNSSVDIDSRSLMGMGSFQGLGLWSRLGDSLKSWLGDVHSCVEARFRLSVVGVGSDGWPD